MLGNFSAWVARNPNYHWWAYGALFVGLFLTVMDQSGTNIALPRIADHFHADIPTVQWVSLGLHADHERVSHAYGPPR